ncbi:UNVERIFIED_CONTAM: hypothetical protein FKN15_007563 [Acipenser sinensis]
MALLVQLLNSQNKLKFDIQNSTMAAQQMCKLEIAETASQLHNEMEGHRNIIEKMEGFECKLKEVCNMAMGEQDQLKERVEQLEKWQTTALSSPAAQQKVKPSKFNGKIDWTTYYQHFEIVSTLNRWTDDEAGPTCY